MTWGHMNARCPALDENHAPAKPCTLKKGHAGQHEAQWGNKTIKFGDAAPETKAEVKPAASTPGKDRIQS